MKKKEIILLVLFLSFIFIPNVFAEENVSIESVMLDSKSENTEITNEGTYEGLSINFDIKFNEVNDYAKYKIVINNQSDEDYEIGTDNKFSESNYITYEYSFDNDDNILKANGDKTMYVTVRYDKELPSEEFTNGTFKEDNKAVIALSNGVKDEPIKEEVPITTDKVEVPDTYTGLSIFIVFAFIALLGYLSYNKLSNKRLLLVIIPIILIPIIVNAYEKLEVKVNTHIEMKEQYNLGKYLVRNYPEKFSKYEGQVTDKVGTTIDARNVYFINDNDNYLVFNNYCWRIVRTTEYGGVKIIYNGQYNNTCTNDSNYIGTTKWYRALASLNSLGYMRSNNAHEMLNIGSANNNVIFGNDVEYKNGEYLLIDQSNESDNNHHYTCNNITGTCEKVRYYYNNGLYNYYTLLENGDKIEDAINKNLYNDVNQKDSAAKIMVEDWFENELIDYINYIDTNVYCNNREITNANETGFNPNGGNITSETDMLFNRNNDLSCNNITDQFSTNNEIAPLKYPIALLSIQEAKHSTDYIKDDKVFWTMSPSSFSRYAYMYVFSDESSTSDFYGRRNVRPVITLKNTNIIDSGQGSINDPYIIKTE